MVTAIALPAGAAFVFPSLHFSSDLVYQETSPNSLETLFDRGDDEFLDFFLGIYLSFLYSFLQSRY